MNKKWNFVYFPCRFDKIKIAGVKSPRLFYLLKQELSSLLLHLLLQLLHLFRSQLLLSWLIFLDRK